MFGTDQEENKLRERIVSLIHMEKLTERTFALKIGRQPTNVYQVLSGERHFPRGFCTDILKNFPHVSKDWLAWGDGSMYGDSKAEQPKNTKPLLPKNLSGGNLEQYYAGDKRGECTEKPIITQFANYDFSIKLKSNRMAPKYMGGDELFFKRVEIVEWGDDLLIDTTEGPKFGRAYEDGGNYRLKSYNPELFPDCLVPSTKKIGFYKCVGMLRIM